MHSTVDKTERFPDPMTSSEQAPKAPVRRRKDSAELNEGIAPSAQPRLAIFGGTFDPVHNGHLFLAGEVVRRGLAHEVLFVPARRPPHKIDVAISPAEHRMAMLTLALAPFREFSLSDIEIARAAGCSYTIDTLEMLREIYPEHELFFLLGMDSLVDLHLWHRATELVQRHRIVTYPRPGVAPPPFATLAGQFGPRNARRLVNDILDMPTAPGESTGIRRLVQAGGNLAGLVPECVSEYMRKQGLYRAGAAVATTVEDKHGAGLASKEI